MADSIDRLFGDLQSRGYAKDKTLTDFRNYMLAPGKQGYENRKQFFDDFKSQGMTDLESYEDFASLIGLQAGKPERVDTPSYQPSAEEMAGFQRTINSANHTATNPAQGYERKEQLMKKRQGLNVPKRVNLGESNNLTPTEQRLNLETGELEQGYMTSYGNEYDNKAIADMDQRQIDKAQRDEQYRQTLPGQLEDAYAERERLNAELGKFQGQWVDQDGRVHYANRGDDESVASLEAALRQNQQRITALEAERDDDGGTQFWRGFLDAAKNPSVQSFGLTDFDDMLQMMRIKSKMDHAKASGQQPQLTAAEQQLMESSYLNNYAQSAYGDNRGFMYRAGGISMQALPFVAEFMTTGGFSAISKKGAQLGVQAAEKLALEGLGKSLVKNLGVVAGDVAAGWAMANTTGLFRTAGDTMQRHIGQVAIDDEGNLGFEGGKSLGRSIYEAQVANTLEYYTEKLGEHLQIGKWLSRGAEKMGLGRLSKAVNYLSNSKWLERGGIQDYPSEVVEEQANLLLNAILVGDNNFSVNPDSKDFDKSVFNPKTQLDIWGGMAFSIGLMQAPRLASTGYNAAGYYAYKKNVDISDGNAAIVFGRENWDMIKEQIDNCDNEQLPALLETVVNGNMKPEQKTATMNYADNLLKMRGYNMGMMVDAKDEEKASTPEAAISQSINQGYQAGRMSQVPDEMKSFVDEATAAGENLPQYGNAFARMVMESQNPSETMLYLLNRRDFFSDEQIGAAADYFQKQAKAQGVMDAAMDRVDVEVERRNAEVRGNTHQQTGSVVMAKGEGDMNYYIIGGDIVTDPDTGMTSLAGTGGAVVVKDAVTGEVKVDSPQKYMMYSMQNADELIQQNETTLREQLMQQADDDITFGSPANEVYDLEDTVTLNDGNGGTIEGTVVTMPNAVDGVYVVQTSDGRALQLTGDDLNRRIVAHNGIEVQRAAAQAPTEGTAEIPQSTEQQGTQSAEQPQQSGNEQAAGETSANNQGEQSAQPQSALSRIPVRTDASGQPVKNRKGRPILDWHKASVEDAAEALIETTGGDVVMARDTASDLVRNEQARLEKIRKQKPKGEDPQEIAESRLEIRRQEQEAQAIIKQWQDVGTNLRKRMEAEAAEKRAAEEAAKSEEQKAREAEAARIRQEQQEAVARERRRKQVEEEVANWNKPYAPLAKARKEMESDPEAMEILNRTEPETLEEWVSSLITPQSMMWDDETDPASGRTVIGLQSELGLQKKDIERIGGLVASRAKGGKPFGQVVHDIWEQLPEGMKNQYDDQDVRNALIGLFGEGNTMRMRHLTEEHRIEQARQTMEENRRRDSEAEMDAWAEAYHLTPEERETFEDWLQQPPTEPEQDIINQIIADNEQNRRSAAVDGQPDGRRVTGQVEGGEGQVQAEGEAEGNGNNAAVVAEAEEDGGNQPSVSGDTVPGGQSDREALTVFFEQIGADPVLAERMSDFEVEQLTALVDEWDAVNSEYGEAIEQRKDELKSKNKEVRDKAQAVVGFFERRANNAFEPVEQYVAELQAKYIPEEGGEFEGAIPNPAVDEPRYQAIRQALVDAYRSGDASAITAAAQAVQQYVDEGLNAPEDHTEIFDIAEEYEGNDPEKLADQYIIRTFWDRYLDDDADKEYIKTGLKPGMRHIAPSKTVEENSALDNTTDTDKTSGRGKRNDTATPQSTVSDSKGTNNSPNNQENQQKSSDLGPTSSPEQIAEEEGKVNTSPSEGQKEAGNYQKGHIKIDGYDITIENPKGSIRRGTDADGKQWESTMHNTYGYIRGTEATDGDHLDVFLSDDPASGNVFVVDQVDPKTGMFDEVKIMIGFTDAAEATKAYLSNYEKGWKGLGTITEVSREDLKKWIESSHRKTKPFADYAMVKKKGIVDDHRADGEVLEPDSQEKALRDAVVDHLRSIGVEVSTDWQEGQRILDEYNGNGQVKKMGTSTRKRQNDILESLKDRSLSEQQKQVADAFSGVSDRIILSVKSKDGKSRNITFRQGNENRAGVKHSVFRHYNTESNGYTADEVTMIPEIIANGNRKQDQGNRVSYKYEKDGITYTVTTEAKGKNELFTNFYTNKKPSVAERGTSNTDNRHVQPQQTDSDAKVQQNPETSKDFERKFYSNKKGDISRTSTPSEEARASDTDNALSGAKVQQNSETANDSDEKIKEQRVYHGSRAEFDEFDHSHMGEGTGSHAFGYGTYVTNSKRIGTDYANITSRGWLYKGMDGKELRASNDDLPEGRYYTDNEIRSFVLDYMNAGSSFEQAVDKVRRSTQSAINDHEEHLSELSPAEKKDLEGFRQELKLIDSFRPEDFKRDDRYLYDVEIPDDTGSNYIDWENPIDQPTVKRVKDAALSLVTENQKKYIEQVEYPEVDPQIEEDLSIFGPSPKYEPDPERLAMEIIDKYLGQLDGKSIRGKDLYNSLSHLFLSERDTSKFLYDLGYVGIKYPAGTIMGGGDGATNYVIFNEGDAKITDRTKFFKTPDGHAYGYTYKGKLYIDPRIATAETPVHEYGHLWCEMKRNTAPEEWNQMKQVMLNDEVVQPIIERVRRDYPELAREGKEDDFIEEVITQFSGKRGAERLKAIADEVAAERGGIFGKAEAVTAMQRLKNILNSFWEGVARMMGWEYRNASQIADRMMADMLNGVNPREWMKETAGERKDFAAEHGIDESLIREYEEGINTEDLARAARAFTDIRRTLRMANKDKKLGEFTELFTPVKEYLFKQYGSIDDLREKQRREAEIRAGVMEAARKREEEARARERERLKELEDMTDEQLDDAYMKALEANDEGRMRDIIDVMGDRRGYTDESDYQGEGAWKAPGNPGYESDEARRADVEANSPDVNITDIARGFSPQPSDYFLNPRAYGYNNSHGRESANAITKAMAKIATGGKNVKVKVYRAVPENVEEGTFRNGDWVTPSRAYAEMHGKNRLEGKYRIIEQEVPADHLWWDGNDVNEWGYDDGSGYRYKNSENNRKLNDLVTRDDEGNVIPPSRRFDEANPDVRFQMVGRKGASEADRAEGADSRMEGNRVAEEMENAGKDAKAIKLATGWERGKDGQWRYEIPDADVDIISKFNDKFAEMKADGVESPEPILRLGELLGENNELFKYYPKMKDMPVLFTKGLPNGTAGAYDKGAIELNTRELDRFDVDDLNNENVYGTLLHEVQHAIQDIEGFAKGGSLMTSTTEEGIGAIIGRKERQRADIKTKLDANRRILDDPEELQGAAELDGKPVNEVKEQLEETVGRQAAEYDNLTAQIERIKKLKTVSMSDAWDLYHRLAGEVESRNVADRMGMTDEQRRQSLASETEDVPREDQVVINGEQNENNSLKFQRTDADEAPKLQKAAPVEPEDEPVNLARKLYEDAIRDTGERSMIPALLSSVSRNNEGWIRFKHKFAESWFDYSRSIKALQDAIEKATGKAIEGFEDVWRALNSKSSIDSVELQRVMHDLIEPLSEYTGAMIKGKEIDGRKMTVDDVEIYLNAVHGIERNEQMAMKQARDEYEEDIALQRQQLESGELGDRERKSLEAALLIKEARFKGISNYMDRPEVEKWYNQWRRSLENARHNGTISEDEYNKASEKMDAEYNQGWQYKYREKDYSGLTALFGEQFEGDEKPTEDVLEQAARDYASKFEDIVGKKAADGLWERVKALNTWSLRKSYESGLISKDQYNDTLTMYQHYVPLRGWHDDYAGDVYQYISRGEPAEVLQGVLKKAYGRKSRAARIFGTMAAMANTAIVQGNKNLVGQRLLNMAMNHQDSGLLMVSEQYYQKTADGDLVPQVPALTDTMTADEMRQELERFEADMKAREDAGEVQKLRKKFKKEMPLHMAKWQEQRHAVRVMRGGREYMVYVLGNPRAAMAFNGLLNPNTQPGVISNNIAKYMRFKAKMQTSLSPEFLISNFERDMTTAATGAYVKFGRDYQRKFVKNLGRVMPLASLKQIVKGKGADNMGGIFSLFRKYDANTLDEGNDMERYFKEFVDFGGMTGISYITKAEEYQASMEKIVKRMRQGKMGKVRSGMKAVGDAVEFANKGIENATRFATYMTSRQQGRSVRDSIFDAKEGSVNFNMKGSGSWGNLMARQMYLYVNPAMQALRMLGTWYENDPVVTATVAGREVARTVGRRFMKAAAAVMTASVGSALLNIMLSQIFHGDDGDDDDKEKGDWWALSEWNRYNFVNIINPFGKGYFHWSIPQELRPLWAMGQIGIDMAFGRVVWQRGLESMLLQLNNLSPLSFFEGGTDTDESLISAELRTLTPSYVSDFTDAYGWNKDFMGHPITNQGEWNKDRPEWQRAGKNTPEIVVKASRKWNELTGGRRNSKSWADSEYLNPSAVYYVLMQQFGGIGSMVKRLLSAFDQWRDPDQSIEKRNLPFLPKFYVETGDDYSRERVVNDKFWMYYNEFMDADHEMSHNRSDVKNGKMTQAEADRAVEERKADGTYDTWKTFRDNGLDYLFKQVRGTDMEREVKRMAVEAMEKGVAPDYDAILNSPGDHGSDALWAKARTRQTERMVEDMEPEEVAGAFDKTDDPRQRKEMARRISKDAGASKDPYGDKPSSDHAYQYQLQRTAEDVMEDAVLLDYQEKMRERGDEEAVKRLSNERKQVHSPAEHLHGGKSDKVIMDYIRRSRKELMRKYGLTTEKKKSAKE